MRAPMNSVFGWRLGQGGALRFAKSSWKRRGSCSLAVHQLSLMAGWRSGFSSVGPPVRIHFSPSICVRVRDSRSSGSRSRCSRYCRSASCPPLFMRTAVAHTAGSRGKVSGIARTASQRWRSNALLVTQVSLSLLLSTISGCFAATLVHWETVDVGMDREHLLSVHVDMHQSISWGSPWQSSALYRQMQARLQVLPGVRNAAVEICGNLHCDWNTALDVNGRSDLTNGQVHGQENHVGS